MMMKKMMMKMKMKMMKMMMMMMKMKMTMKKMEMMMQQGQSWGCRVSPPPRLSGRDRRQRAAQLAE